MTTAGSKTQDSLNLCWGRLTASSLNQVKFWLVYMANLWVEATHMDDHEFVNARDALWAIEADLENLSFPLDEMARRNEIERIVDAFSYLAGILREAGGSNPTLLMIERIGSGFVLLWEGEWTRGRYVRIIVSPLELKKLSVEWNTATFEESRFLSLPSKAIEATQEEGVRIQPLRNIHREVYLQLGLDPIWGVEEAHGPWCVRRVENIFVSHLKELVKVAIQQARQEGYCPAEF